MNSCWTGKLPDVTRSNSIQQYILNSDQNYFLLMLIVFLLRTSINMALRTCQRWGSKSGWNRCSDLIIIWGPELILSWIRGCWVFTSWLRRRKIIRIMGWMWKVGMGKRKWRKRKFRRKRKRRKKKKGEKGRRGRSVQKGSRRRGSIPRRVRKFWSKK